MGVINKTLLPLKLYNYFFFGSTACVFPIVPAYMMKLGISPFQLSVIYAFMPFAGFLSRPITGYITDKYQCYKLIAIVSTIICGVANALHLAVPPSQGISAVPCGVQVVCSVARTDCDIIGQSYFPFCQQKQTSDLNETNSISCQGTELSSAPAMCYLNTIRNASVHSLSFSMDINSNDKKPIFGCENTVSNQSKCPLDAVKEIQCTVDCNNKDESECSDLIGSLPPEESLFSVTFVSLFILQLVATLSVATLMPLIDAITLESVEKDQVKYGLQRVWGSIGFGSISAIVGLGIFLFADSKGCSVKHFSDFYFYFYFYLVFMLLCTISSFFLINAHPSKPPEFLVKKVVGVILHNLDVVLFFVVLFVTGMLTGVFEAFVFAYFINHLHATPIATGLCITLACLLAETPMMFFSGKIMTKISQRGCLCIALFAWGFRFLLYTFVDHYWWQVPIELLHGLTFGLMFPAASTYVAKVSPEGTTTTMQSLMQGIHFGVSKGIGSFVGGGIMKATSYSFIRLFYIASGFAFGSAILYTIYVLVHPFNPDTVATSTPLVVSADTKSPNVLANGRFDAEENAEEDSVFISGTEKV